MSAPGIDRVGAARLRRAEPVAGGFGDPSRGPIDLGAAFVRHRHDLAATAARLLCRRDDVDDLVQDVFVEALRGVHNLRRPAALRAWLTRVTVRAARRRLARRRFLALEELPEAQVSDGGAGSPAHRAVITELCEALAASPPEWRRAWTLRYLEGEQLAAIAEQCRCSVATVKRRLAEVQALVPSP